MTFFERHSKLSSFRSAFGTTALYKFSDNRILWVVLVRFAVLDEANHDRIDGQRDVQKRLRDQVGQSATKAVGNMNEPSSSSPPD